MGDRIRMAATIGAIVVSALLIVGVGVAVWRSVWGGGSGPGAPHGEGQTQGETTARTAAPRTSSPPVPDGCLPMPADVFDELSDTLEDGSTVELSVMWEGTSRYSDERMEMAAMMVRSPEGTINAPQLVWFNDDGTWVSVTAETVRDSSAPDGTDRVDRHDNPVSQVIGCLVNPHR